VSRITSILIRFGRPSLARRTGENLSFGKCNEFVSRIAAGAEKRLKLPFMYTTSLFCRSRRYQ
jgi:hypothetical protein